jgi:hypothetical protein
LRAAAGFFLFLVGMAWISPIGAGLEMWRDRPGREPPHAAGAGTGAVGQIVIRYMTRRLPRSVSRRS